MKTDLSYLEELSGGSNELIQEMIDIFYVQVEEFGSEMEEYLSKKNWDSLSKLAHKAKSSVSIMGMEELAKDLKTLELLAKEEKEVEKYREFVDKFKSDCNIAVEELKEYSAKL